MNFSERQIEIIDASMQLIAAKGIQHLTTKNLAAAMNFSEPSIYRHFKNKSDIVQSALSYFQGKMKNQTQAVMNSDEDALEKLRKLIEIQFYYFSEFPVYSLLVFSELIFQGDESLSQMVKLAIDQRLDFIEKLVLKGQEEGVIRRDVPSGDLVTMYIGCIRFTLLKWKLDNFRSDLKKEGIKINNMITSLLS
jgi:AcrR family transcriptional regulator